REVKVKEMNPRAPAIVTTPVRAHLSDGSTIVFPKGVSVQGNSVVGEGSRFAAGSNDVSPSTSVPLDSVLGMEAFETDTLVAKTLLASTATTALTAIGIAGLAVAIFGSCPTL